MPEGMFDTCLFVDYWRGDFAAQQHINQVMDGSFTAYFSPITVMELWQFPGMDRREEIEYAALQLLMREIPLDSVVARQAGLSVRSLSRGQRRRRIGDALIAASADSLNLPVYTRNVRDVGKFYQNVISY